jgi:heme exporter protein D
MLERIIADYGFYMGWSFGVTALLMLLEPVVINVQRGSIVQRLRRIARAAKNNQ